MRDIRHLLVVAGLSGSGKTTFLSALASHQLPAELIGRLPFGAASWPLAYGHFEIGRSGQKLADEIPGLILHYPLNRLSDISDFRRDPVLELFNMAARITVVHLKVSPKRLIEQIVHRQMTKKKCRAFW
ncbi:MAG: hypothetical protein ACREC3_16195 [Methyloceanibacter sp.]